MNRLLFSEDIAMTFMRVCRAAQLALPADVRQALNVKEGDYLEAHITKDGVLLTPVQIVERKRAWQGILHAMSQVRDTQPDSNENVIAEEESITEEVKAFRHKHV
jgi:AbrB family looped-hinge helix DNA binding protein